MGRQARDGMDGLLGAAGEETTSAGDLDGLDRVRNARPAHSSVAFAIRVSARPWPRSWDRSAVGTRDQGRTGLRRRAAWVATSRIRRPAHSDAVARSSSLGLSSRSATSRAFLHRSRRPDLPSRVGAADGPCRACRVAVSQESKICSRRSRHRVLFWVEFLS